MEWFKNKYPDLEPGDWRKLMKELGWSSCGCKRNIYIKKLNKMWGTNFEKNKIK